MVSMRYMVVTTWLVLTWAGAAHAGDVTAAVAANFISPFQSIAIEFEKSTGHRVEAIAGSSGKFYSQIKNGAPFDLFLSADRERPQLLEDEGLAVKGSRFTYAVGRLVLWSADADLVRGEETLRTGTFKHVAMANPQLAPYGMAAKQVMTKLAVWDQLQPRIVQGESIGQTMGFVASGSAELGFVALSQVVDPARKPTGSRWDVPLDLYDPVDQDGVLLVRGVGNAAAAALMEYVRSSDARAIITRFGYGLK